MIEPDDFAWLMARDQMLNEVTAERDSLLKELETAYQERDVLLARLDELGEL